MNPILHVPGRVGLYALNLFVGKPIRPAGGAAPKVPLQDGALAEWSLCDMEVPPIDPDDSICKLSLTRDEGKRPRAKKGSFGYDFEPFM